jgi:hypothetical protein
VLGSQYLYCTTGRIEKTIGKSKNWKKIQL